jgi:hypothetical protein
MTREEENEWLRCMFQKTPMPATLEELEKGCGPSQEKLASWLVLTRLNNGVIADEDKYWLADDVMAEGVRIAEKQIADWQKFLNYWNRERKALALRGLAQTSKKHPKKSA